MRMKCVMIVVVSVLCVFFFQAEDGIRDLVRSRGLGDVYKRQQPALHRPGRPPTSLVDQPGQEPDGEVGQDVDEYVCLLYTSDAADERSSVDLGGRRIIKKKTKPRRDRAVEDKLCRDSYRS